MAGDAISRPNYPTATAATMKKRSKKKKKMMISSSSSSDDQRWEVEFARFFNFPRRSPSSLSHLHRLPKFKTRRSGTWILSESPATLRILRSSSSPSPSFPVISVAVAGVIVEEHFVSNLHFSWPQVSCVPECPVRGSRAVFLSYRDISEHIQKFAVRFPTISDAEIFLKSVKEHLHDSMGIAHQGCDIVCENSSPSKVTASNGLHSRISEDSSYEEPVATYPAEFPALTYNDEQLEPLLANNIDTVFSGLPPSFTELLNNCSTDAGKEQSMAGEDTKCTSLREGSLNPPSYSATEPLLLMAEKDLQSQLTQYMTDASFHDLLFKIEKVIDEMGGDLSL